METGAGGHALLETDICVELRCDNVKGGLKRKDADQTNETCAVVEANADGAFVGGSSVDVDVDYYGYPLTGRGGLAGSLSEGGYMTRSAGSLFQTIDVGVDASTQMKGGAFQLLYGSARTGCIQYDAGDGGTRSVRNQLNQLAEVRAIGGVRKVLTYARANGYRFVVEFAAAHCSPLKLRPAVDRVGEECDLLDPPDAQVVIDAEEVITLKRDAQPGSSFILKVVNGSIAANETLSISIPRVATPVYGVGVSGATSLHPRVWSARSPYARLRTGASLSDRPANWTSETPDASPVVPAYVALKPALLALSLIHI